MAVTKKTATRKRKPVSSSTSRARKTTAASKPAVARARSAKAAAAKSAASKVATKKASGKSVAGDSRRAGESAARGAGGRKPPRPALLEALYAEHRHIASVMALFRQQLDAIESGELVDTHVVYEIMDYMVAWPDRFHHPREDLIYGRVAELDAVVADHVDSLQRDHDATADAGTDLLRNIQLWRDGELSGEVLVQSGRAYVNHMYEHMNSEEELVFPQIEQVLTATDWYELTRDDQLQPVPDPVFGHRIQRDFRNVARKLRSNMRRGVEHGTMVEWLSIEAFMESLDVVSMAYESARDAAGEHLRLAWDEGLELFRESLLTAPWRCAANNTRLGYRFMQDVAEISKDALDDLSRVNQERKDRIRLMDS